jgi:ABC-type polysaccharide/polyol phosphate export permease
LPAPVQIFFRYSEVIKNLTKRDFKLRYRSSVFGFAWSFLNPLSFMIVMSIVFGIIFPTGIPNYPVYLLCGLLPWRFFQVATTQSLQSIVNNSSLVSRVYLPRQILVLSTVLANLMGTLIEFSILFPLMLAFRVPIRPIVLLFVPLLLYEFLLVFAVSLALSALFVFYRDLMHLWEVFLNIGIWAAPVMYSLNQLPKRWLPFYGLNPIVPMILSFQNVMLYATFPRPLTLVQMTINLLAALGIGIALFKHFEPRFADEVA